MQPEGAGYRISFHRLGSGLSHTIACSDAPTTRVRVYASQDRTVPKRVPRRFLNPVRYPLDQTCS